MQERGEEIFMLVNKDYVTEERTDLIDRGLDDQCRDIKQPKESLFRRTRARLEFALRTQHLRTETSLFPPRREGPWFWKNMKQETKPMLSFTEGSLLTHGEEQEVP